MEKKSKSTADLEVLYERLQQAATVYGIDNTGDLISRHLDEVLVLIRASVAYRNLVFDAEDSSVIKEQKV